MKIALKLAFACLLLAPVAAAQTAGSKVTVTVNNVRSDAGTVRGALCADPTLFGQSSCAAATAAVPAKTGSVVLTFTGVKPGTYALAVFHDEDGDNKLNIMTEPMAFGNGDTALPPVFDGSALKVTGDLKTETALFKMIP